MGQLINQAKLRSIGRSLYVSLANISGFPWFIQIETTTKCNLKCEMCEHSILSDTTKIIDFEEFKKIYKTISRANPLAKLFPRLQLFDLTGIGESLLNKDFIKILNYLKSTGATVTFTTNATLLNDTISKKIIDSGVDVVFFSVDGASKETFEKIRVGANFERVKENIRRFNELRVLSGNKKPKTIIRFLASSWNVHEMPEIINFAEETGVPTVTITNMNTSEDTAHLKADMGKFYEMKEITTKKAKKLGVVADYGFIKQRPMNECRRAFNSMYLTVNGQVLPCCFINQGGEYDDIADNKNLGDVFKENIKDIWKSEKYKDFRKLIKKGKAPDVCKNCYLFYPTKK
jgi:radical SAM protein with 4Fe4S-binding SPASM domain